MEELKYYRVAGEITRLDRYKEFTSWLTDNPDAICQVVQGLITHDLWFDRYGLHYIVEHEYPQKTAYMEDLLDIALKIDPSNLAIPRHPRDRVVACCREFSTMMTAILRAKGIPARSRCGFATYFGWGGTYEDHWICEYWNGEKWIMCDPQIDPLQQTYMINWGLENINSLEGMKQIKTFDPHHLREGEFIPAGEAWLLCRRQQKDASLFGIGCEIDPAWGIDSLHGLWFIRGQLLRDFASLNKVETEPYLVRICKKLDWQSWHLVGAKDEELNAEELKLLDEIAELTLDVENNFEKILTLYQEKDGLKVPVEIIER